jgi:hypothetical protein
MTKRERDSRPDRPSRGRSPDALLDLSLLDGGSLDEGSRDSGSRDSGSLGGVALPDGEPTPWQPVAQVLAALTSAPESSELTGEARALAEFRAFAPGRAFAEIPPGGADLPPPAPRRDPRRKTWLPRGRLALAAATSALMMGGLLAVAYAGDLPGPAQRLAHNTIHAPAARPDRDPAVSSQPTGSPKPAGRAGQQTTRSPVGPDREVPRSSASGHPPRHGSSSSPSARSSGRPGSGRLGSGRRGQPGRPGRSGESGPILPPVPSASISPPAGATPSPSAAPSPSQSAPPYPQQSPSTLESTPP